MVDIKYGKNILNKLFDYIMPRGRNQSGLKVVYKKTFKIVGYKHNPETDRALKERYYKSAASFNLNKSLRDIAVQDNLYFLETYLGRELKKTKKTKLLDVGCGTGTYGKIFKTRKSFLKNTKYYGTEINQQLVDICSQTYKNGHFTVATADSLDYPDNYFDIIFSSSVLHYALKKWKESLEEMARVSKKYLVITRIPVSKYNKSFFVTQTVDSINGHEEHVFIVINREILEDYFDSLGLRLLQRDYTSEEYQIESVDEKIILAQYLLEKK